jgi:hypothetical protein
LLTALLCLLAMAAAAPRSVADDGFLGFRLDYRVADYTAFPAVGDVNGDGKPDIVTVGSGIDRNGVISVLLNTGTGTFGNRRDYAGGSELRLPTLGDVNGDGKLDIVTSHGDWSVPGSVGILLNAGDGTFHSRQEYPVGYHPMHLAVGDVNGDGRNDIVTANQSGSVTVLQNTGNGVFTRRDYAVGPWESWGLALGDVNGDGKLDIVTTAGFYRVVVLLNAGDGTFGSRQDYNSGYVMSVALGDVNGDSHLDIVTAGSNNVGVFLNAGDGTFGNRQDYYVGREDFSCDVWGVALGDINGDGKLDIVATIYLEPEYFSVLYNQGDGTFGNRQDYEPGGLVTATVGDVNNDGYADVVATNQRHYTVHVYLHLTGATVPVSGRLARSELAPYADRQRIAFTFRPPVGQSVTIEEWIESDGTFSIPAAPAGLYQMHVKGDRYLAKNLFIDTTHPIDDFVSSFFVGDANSDGSVDVLDLDILIRAFDSTPVRPNWNADADFNGDQSVDMEDLTILINNFDRVEMAAMLIPGDANNDNSIDVLDLDLLIQAFDSLPGHPNWNANADFNGDRSVDTLDLDLLIQNFDIQGDP